MRGGLTWTNQIVTKDANLFDAKATIAPASLLFSIAKKIQLKNDRGLTSAFYDFVLLQYAVAAAVLPLHHSLDSSEHIYTHDCLQETNTNRDMRKRKMENPRRSTFLSF